MKSITNEDGFIQIIIPPGSYEKQALDKEIKRIVIGEDHYTEAQNPTKLLNIRIKYWNFANKTDNQFYVWWYYKRSFRIQCKNIIWRIQHHLILSI